MYKIYIHEKPLILQSKGEHPQNDFKTIVYDNKTDTLQAIVGAFENNSSAEEGLNIESNDLEKLKKDFFQLFKLIEAAGGLIFNSENKILAIKRLGFWDLPKGKTEKGESIEMTAIREVQEETGLDKVEIVRPLVQTYHTYFDERKNKKILKISHWFLMKTEETQLRPQAEEAIESAVWLTLAEMKTKTPVYQNILEVLKSI